MSLSSSASPRLVPKVLEALPNEAQVERLLQQYPLSADGRYFGYGTAGFRYAADLLPPIFVRVGVFAALRSLQLQCQAVGCMVTASHNDESYNGIKIADPDGGMLAEDGEGPLVELVNVRDMSRLLGMIRSLQKSYQADVSSSSSASSSSSTSNTPVVHVGRDTRSHSLPLTELLVGAARSMGAQVVNHGVVTTPMLHAVVQNANHATQQHHVPILAHVPPCSPTVEAYYDRLVQSYLALIGDDASQQASPPRVVRVDCACGVGYLHLQAVASRLEQASSNSCTRILPMNAPGEGPLNVDCGSEHVQKGQEAPIWHGTASGTDSIQASFDYCASLDGDADRIVFFAQPLERDDSNKTTLRFLLDGDKITCLLCLFLQEQLEMVVEEIATAAVSLEPLMGVVQTSYANGASTQFLKRLLGDAQVRIAKTGVKFVHAAAHSFDIGVYFEANGHGTIVFNQQFYDWIASVESSSCTLSPKAAQALRRLHVLPQLVNQAVGDALSDLLLVDAILYLRNWTLDDWNRLYTDLPSRQCKVRVRDRSVLVVNDNETICLQPAVVQSELNAAMAQGGRAFVRPSGTEDVVRVYAEADTQQAADNLAQRAAAIVYRLAGGVGEPPAGAERINDRPPASRM